MKKSKKELKPTNITDQELLRDIVNLNLPEVNLLEDIGKIGEDDPAYSKEFNDWLRNGRPTENTIEDDDEK